MIIDTLNKINTYLGTFMYKSYVYKLTNKITGQFYYGSRCRNVTYLRTPEEDLWKYYFSSSGKVKELISLYGKESFEIEIIFTDAEYDKCYWFEQQNIADNVINKLCLNQRYVDPKSGLKIFSSSGSIPHNKGKKTPIEVRQKQSDSAKLRPPMSEDTKRKMGESRTGDKNPRGMLGKKYTPESRKKLSESLIGKNKGKVYGPQSAELIEKRVGHRRGKPRPTAECPYCGKVGGATQMIQWHFDKCKNK